MFPIIGSTNFILKAIKMLDFNELERKYGSPAAEALLRQIEKVARIQSWAMAGLDPQTRLENALRVQDAMERQPFMLMAA